MDFHSFIKKKKLLQAFGICYRIFMTKKDVNKCIIFGGGGHARVLIDCLQSSQPDLELAIVDNSPLVTEVLGIPVAGNENTVYKLVKEGYSHFAVGVGSTGDTSIRRRIYDFALSCKLIPLTAIHPNTTVSKHASIAPGAQIFAGVVINPGAILKEMCIINTGAIVEHDCLVESFAHIAPGATIAGGVTICSDAHIGMNSSVRERIIIGQRALIGAGAVVVKNVEPNTTMVGIPARKLKK